jgi:hypothetical protein
MGALHEFRRLYTVVHKSWPSRKDLTETGGSLATPLDIPTLLNEFFTRLREARISFGAFFFPIRPQN